MSYLPPDISSEVSRSFKTSISLTIGIEIRGEAENKIVKFVKDYLSEHERGYAIIETVGRVGDPWINLLTVPYFIFESVVYIFLSHQCRGLGDVRILLHHARDYPFVCGLTSLPPPLPPIVTGQLLAKEAIEQLAMNVEHILIGAYDAEGFLIWSKGRPNEGAGTPSVGL